LYYKIAPKEVTVTNFIRSYLHQIFDDSHGLKASLKPLRKPFDRCQSRLEAINNGRDIKQDQLVTTMLLFIKLLISRKPP